LHAYACACACACVRACACLCARACLRVRVRWWWSLCVWCALASAQAWLPKAAQHPVPSALPKAAQHPVPSATCGRRADSALGARAVVAVAAQCVYRSVCAASCRQVGVRACSILTRCGTAPPSGGVCLALVSCNAARGACLALFVFCCSCQRVFLACFLNGGT